MSRRAAKIDANQTAIIKALRAAGASVQPLHTVGSGCPDLLVGYRSRNVLLEIKDGELSPSHRKLTEAQAEWHFRWNGRVHVVKDVTEALFAVGVPYRKHEAARD